MSFFICKDFGADLYGTIFSILEQHKAVPSTCCNASIALATILKEHPSTKQEQTEYRIQLLISLCDQYDFNNDKMTLLNLCATLSTLLFDQKESIKAKYGEKCIEMAMSVMVKYSEEKSCFVNSSSIIANIAGNNFTLGRKVGIDGIQRILYVFEKHSSHPNACTNTLKVIVAVLPSLSKEEQEIIGKAIYDCTIKSISLHSEEESVFNSLTLESSSIFNEITCLRKYSTIEGVRRLFLLARQYSYNPESSGNVFRLLSCLFSENYNVKKSVEKESIMFMLSILSKHSGNAWVCGNVFYAIGSFVSGLIELKEMVGTKGFDEVVSAAQSFTSVGWVSQYALYALGNIVNGVPSLKQYAQNNTEAASLIQTILEEHPQDEEVSKWAKGTLTKIYDVANINEILLEFQEMKEQWVLNAKLISFVTECDSPFTNVWFAMQDVLEFLEPNIFSIITEARENTVEIELSASKKLRT